MDRVNPSSRRDAYGSRINRVHSPVLVYGVPIFTVIFGSILAILPMASAVPLLPPLGFVFLLGWRLVRPGLFPIWAGFPLGMVDDMFSGQPFGSAILLWSLTLIFIELIEVRFPWRTFVQDWATAIAAILLYLLAGAFLSGASVGWPLLTGLVPQFLFSILIFPIFARIVARLDRFRLMRVRKIG